MSIKPAMRTLLIVDDHKLLVDSMAHTIAWESVGIGTVYKAYSGPEAMALLELHNVDVLITDIRMPGLTGLELIEQARVVHPELQCVLLTGYAQFEYARKAIELRAINYLVKPVQDEQLLETVGQITENLESHSEADRSRQSLRFNLPLLRGKLLLELLAEDGVPRRSLEDKLSMYELAYKEGDSCRIILVDPGFSLDHYSAPDRSLLEYSILNIVEETLSPVFELWIAQSEFRQIVILVKQRIALADDSSYRISTEWLRANVRQYLKSNLSVFVSKELEFPSGLPQAYWRGMALLQRHSGDPNGAFVLEDEEVDGTNKTKSLRKLHQAPTLMQLAESNNIQGLRDKFRSLFEELQSVGPHSIPLLIEARVHLLSCFVSIAHRRGRVLAEMIGPWHTDLTQPIHSHEKLKEWADAVLELLTQDLNLEEHADVHGHVVNQVQRYVHDHLDKDIGLQAISEHVYLNSAYLSKIYKDKTGVKLSDFILQTRMERAKLLLKEHDRKIYEIAEMVGYQSTQHFIREFKKYYGSTPKIYRSIME